MLTVAKRLCLSSCYFTAVLHSLLCFDSFTHESRLIFLCFRFLLMVSLNHSRGLPVFLWPTGSCENRICFGSLSCGILKRCPLHRRFFLIKRSSVDGSPVLSNISLLVTMSFQVISGESRTSGHLEIFMSCKHSYSDALYRKLKSSPYILYLNNTKSYYAKFTTILLQ